MSFTCRCAKWLVRCGAPLAIAFRELDAYADTATQGEPGSLTSGHTPLAYFLRGEGPAAQPVLHLGWMLAGICSFVCVLIAIMLLVAIFKRRRQEDANALNTKGGPSFVYVGTTISTLALLAITVYMLVVLAQVADPPREPALTVTVTAYDWWWKVDYEEDTKGTRRFATANELHIPVGVPVLVLLKSADVIHAFWVPELSGKTQAIPGVTNRQWLEADRPGVFRGQCTQYCGVQHAHMAFEVYAQPQAEFDRWLGAQQSPPLAATNDSAKRGAKLFEDRCAGCHAIRGSNAAGVQAPDLTHVMSRRLIAAGTIVNTPKNMIDWVQHVQDIKPGALMPDMKLSPAEASDLSAYLATLR
ncbi:cytochrome c oxidase subunit II [Paraburkholderia phenoliruptrix]|uniref:cytochrome c oxidase subunit II n=1 Tax=Paraburkholderia phenoliruptrix TaxID=252970 RepID=UPI001C6F0C50|nr:cytochrome c oxidase subunit II [Paraburkholderia phenoliruptrix]MBW9128407.1 cytochrome c oxidase subunit II [Paraburkholderia ginsengiterrae]